MDGACEATRNRPQLRCRRFYALAVSGEYPPIKYGSERSANAPGGKPKTDAYPAIENAARGTLQGQRDLMFYPEDVYSRTLLCVACLSMAHGIPEACRLTTGRRSAACGMPRISGRYYVLPRVDRGIGYLSCRGSVYTQTHTCAPCPQVLERVRGPARSLVLATPEACLLDKACCLKRAARRAIGPSQRP